MGTCCRERALRVYQRSAPAQAGSDARLHHLKDKPLDMTRPLYMMCPHMGMNLFTRELKRGSTELLILALLEERDRHGYEIARLISERSRGAIQFHVASLYPTLYRMEEKDL